MMSSLPPGVTPITATGWTQEGELQELYRQQAALSKQAHLGKEWPPASDWLNFCTLSRGEGHLKRKKSM